MVIDMITAYITRSIRGLLSGDIISDLFAVVGLLMLCAVLSVACVIAQDFEGFVGDGNTHVSSVVGME